MKGKPRVDVACFGCGREGKSQFPKSYLCSVCYSERNAAACEQKIIELREKIAKIEIEARGYRSAADHYSRKWYGKPSKILGDRLP